MVQPKRWPREGLVPIFSGLTWIWCASGFGFFGFLLALIPGCLLLSSGVGMLLYPGDFRIPQFGALGGFLGVLIGIPILLFSGLLTGLWLILLSIGSYLAVGWFSVLQEPHVENVPVPIPSLSLAAQVAIDEVILAGMLVRAPVLEDPPLLKAEAHAAREMFSQRGWLDRPETYHQTPPPLVDPELTRRSVGGVSFEHLTFESGYQPYEGEPGRDRWMSYARNRTAHAWVFRHNDKPRPWLICIHGYQMGIPRIDFVAFRAMQMHQRYGINLCMPVLPLHGPRRMGQMSGDGFIAGNTLDTIHAEAQAMWDIRRLLTWVRAQAGGPVGAYGLSLGGYNASLLASLDGDLACVIAGIPAMDFARLTWRHGPPPQLRYAEHHGLVHDEVAEILQVVSPLTLTPKVPKERRYIFAAVADRLVPPDQPRDLWEHWDRPRIEWYQGAHISFRVHPQIELLRLHALQEAGVIATA